MVSVETFRVLGYVYGILGIAGSTFEMTKCILRIAIGHIEHHQRHFNSEHFRQAQDVSTVFALPLCALWMVFFVILILGIKQKNLILVRAHKMFLIISNAIGFIILGIGILVLTIFYNEKDAKLARVILVIVLVIGLASYLLALWIVNGVIRYIETDRIINNTEVVIFHPDVQHHVQFEYDYTPV
ncbi:hypothetical protein quinque_015804 [Culex quinquefasciatus]|uniref:uncharacterized protein LOC119769831 n=1 Tax=Culex quinquefasciatus TaxID=7176 RepID=UPI0018E38B95|nr:uncharacterized protein LOC119769831 [Culex quinquefasciatus]